MARKKAETTESQPKKRASKAISKAQTAAPSGPEGPATGGPEEQAAVPHSPEATVEGPSEEQPAAPSGPEGPVTGTSEEQAAEPIDSEATVERPSEEQAAVPNSPEAPETEPSVEQTAPASEAEAAAKAPEDTEEGQASPEEKDGAGDEPQGCPAVVCSGRGLNLRVGPALSYDVLEVLPDGAEVTALELPRGTEVPGWRLVFTIRSDLTILTGWVQSRFLRLER